MRILIVYGTAGAGHRRAAEALAEAARIQCPGATVQCVDILDYTPGWFRSGYGRTYLFLVRRLPWVWKISYHALEVEAVFRLVQPLRRAWNLSLTKSFARALQAAPPDAIVTTHFLPSDVCSAGRRSGWLRAPLVVVVTDWHPHRFWIFPEADATIVSSQDAASLCVRRGLAPDRVRRFGIPIGRAFSQAADRDGITRRLQVRPDRRTVLITSGGTTVGQFERVVEALIGLESQRPGTMQLLVVCGEDEGARRRLCKKAERCAMPMRVFGFVENMAELMAVSDLAVAKAGGLTVSEALGQGLPMVLYHVIPGQEQMNARYVAQHGAAVIAQRPAAVAKAVHRAFADDDRLGRMRAATLALRRPGAAADIIAQVVQPMIPR